MDVVGQRSNPVVICVVIDAYCILQIVFIIIYLIGIHSVNIIISNL